MSPAWFAFSLGAWEASLCEAVNAPSPDGGMVLNVDAGSEAPSVACPPGGVACLTLMVLLLVPMNRTSRFMLIR